MNSTNTSGESHLSGGVTLIVITLFVISCLYLVALRSQIIQYRRRVLHDPLAPRSKLMDAGLRLEEGIERNPLVRGADYAMFHTIPGRMFSLSVIRMDEFISTALAFVFSQALYGFAQYEISLLDNKGQGHVNYLVFTFVVVILWILLSSTMNDFLRSGLGFQGFNPTTSVEQKKV